MKILSMTMLIVGTCAGLCVVPRIIRADVAVCPFNDGWEFSEDGGNVWSSIDLPHDVLASRPYTNLVDHGEQGYVRGGIFRYRKLWKPMVVQPDERLAVRFDGVHMDSTVSVNGKVVGGRRNGFVPFEVPLELDGRANFIEVTVRSVTPNARWNAGAGILRNVWLVRRRGFSVSREDVAIRVVAVTNGCAELEVSSDVGTVVEPAGGRLTIRSPRLWSPDDPYLYDVRVVVRDAAGVTSSVVIPYGIRTIRFTKDDGLHLNGRRMQIQGVCQHEGGPCIGPVLNVAVLEYALREMKKIGVNAIRTVHNPFPPEFYALCDRLGFLVFNELFDEWQIPKTACGYSRFFADEWRRDVETIVRRDRNHPSVFLWSIGNEIPELAGRDKTHKPEEIVELVRKMRDLIHRLDGTRPVSAGLNAADWSAANGICDVLDVVGLNYCAGCYGAFRGKYAIFGSETAATYSLRDVYHYRDNGSNALEIVKSVGFLAGAYSSVPWWGGIDLDQEATLRRQMEAPWSAGEFTWCFFDYLGEGSHAECRNSAFWPAVSSSWGMYDFAGLPKDRAYLNQSCWTTNAMVHLLPDWTQTVRQGTKVPVWCYTNCEKVELFLNGVSQGVRERSADTLHLAWDVPYEPGELKACAYRHGTLAAMDIRRTAGAATDIQQTVLFDDGHTFMVRFDAVDAQGNRVTACEDNLELQPFGCTLLASANGSPLDKVLRQERMRRLFRGAMSAWFVRQTPNARVTCRRRPEVSAQYISHRGDMAVERENSLAAVKRAHACGVVGCEIDVRVRKDGVLALGHDRLRPGAATFEEVVRYMAENGMFPLLDVKEPAATKPAIDILRKYGLLEKTMTIVYTAEEAKRHKALDSAISPFILSHRKKGETDDDYLARYERMFAESGVDGAFLSTGNRHLAERFHAKGYRVMFGSFTRQGADRPFAKVGDFVIVDDPSFAR